MKLENSFSVRAPIDEVWAALLDLERVAPCVPGARVLERLGEDAYEIGLDVALGAPAISYQGQVKIVEQAPADRRAVLRVQADGDGEETAEGRIEVSLVKQGELTEGRLAADLSLGGHAATVDRAVLRGLADRLIDDFARNLAALLGGGMPTVNGADPASSTARMPATVGEMLPEGHPVRVAPAVPGAVRSDPREAAESPAATVEPPPEPAAARADPGEGSWAGATRQAGATIERLRSPLGALLLGLLLAGAVLAWYRRADGAPAGEPEPPPEPAA